MTETAPFPDGFLWGAATSAYQVEGSPLADGAGPSIWHAFAHSPGHIADGQTGDIACDHYRRYGEDLTLMRDLGLNAYRFSINWARVLPEGTGRINTGGLDFYRRLADGLNDLGIAPMATLYHWDLPLALQNRGGWLNRDSAGWFGDYTQTVVRALGDRVHLWATLNEPWVVAVGGHLNGDLAPGHRSPAEAALVGHNLLRAHATGVQAFRAEACAPGRADAHQGIGLVVNLEPQHPASDSEHDREAAIRRDAFINRWFLDPALLGTYPQALMEGFGPAWPAYPPGDLHLIRQPLDFIGVNYYSRSVVRHARGDIPARAARVRQDGRLHTAMDWEVYPQGLTETLVRVKEDYGNPRLYVTENGAAFPDPEPQDGSVADLERTAYLRAHLQAARRAMGQGVDLRGYFAWSLLDNFEWAYGYTKRFGLIHVDFTTQVRTPKASARLYAKVIGSRGALLDGDQGVEDPGDSSRTSS
jgi:beta-glucosidase